MYVRIAAENWFAAREKQEVKAGFMTRKMYLFITLCFLVLSVQIGFGQGLPAKIKSYLNQHYKGWKLSPSEKGCGPATNNGFVSGNFNGDRKLDYVVKFSRGKKGYILAFLNLRNGFKPFILHDTEAEEVKHLSLGILKKGSKFSYDGANSVDKLFRLRYDAPEDYFCESDVGGIHYYKNGKFVGY